MSRIPDEMRMTIEKDIDSFLKNIGPFNDTATNMLIDVGIEPGLETILAFTTGLIIGKVPLPKKKENYSYDVFAEIIQRRIWELRQSLIRTRFK